MDKSIRRSLEEARKECEPTVLIIQNSCTETLQLNPFYTGPFVSAGCGVEVRRQEKHQMEGEEGVRKAVLKMLHKLFTAV